jgi:hypothetical protein
VLMAPVIALIIMEAQQVIGAPSAVERQDGPAGEDASRSA